MSNTFFTADTHFGHEEIIEWSQRPFSSVHEMDEIIIENWNKVVRPGDTVYHLGDFTLRKKVSQYRERLNGNIYLIRGNHDNSKLVKLARFVVVKDLHVVQMGKQKIVLSHYPMRTWFGSKKGAIHLHGHAHGYLRPYMKSFDVGVDCHNYTPYSYEEVIERASKLEIENNLCPEPDEKYMWFDSISEGEGGYE